MQLFSNMSLDETHDQRRSDDEKDEINQPDAQLKFRRADDHEWSQWDGNHQHKRHEQPLTFSVVPVAQRREKPKSLLPVRERRLRAWREVFRHDVAPILAVRRRVVTRAIQSKATRRRQAGCRSHSARNESWRPQEGERACSTRCAADALHLDRILIRRRAVRHRNRHEEEGIERRLLPGLAHPALKTTPHPRQAVQEDVRVRPCKALTHDRSEHLIRTIPIAHMADGASVRGELNGHKVVSGGGRKRHEPLQFRTLGLKDMSLGDLTDTGEDAGQLERKHRLVRRPRELKARRCSS